MSDWEMPRIYADTVSRFCDISSRRDENRCVCYIRCLPESYFSISRRGALTVRVSRYREITDIVCVEDRRTRTAIPVVCMEFRDTPSRDFAKLAVSLSQGRQIRAVHSTDLRICDRPRTAKILGILR